MNLPSHSALPEPLRIPAPVGAVLSRLPAYPGSVLLVTALNLSLARHLPDDVGQLLQHKKMRVHVRDARVGSTLPGRAGALRPTRPWCRPQRPT